MNSLTLELTNSCNLNCSLCSRLIKNQKKKWFMDLKIVEESLKKFSASVFSAVFLTGGEPTLHPEINNIISTILENKRFVFLSTNGRKINIIKKSLLKKITIIFTYYPKINENELSEIKILDKNNLIKKLVIRKRTKKQFFNPLNFPKMNAKKISYYSKFCSKDIRISKNKIYPCCNAPMIEREFKVTNCSVNLKEYDFQDIMTPCKNCFVINMIKKNIFLYMLFQYVPFKDKIYYPIKNFINKFVIIKFC